MEHDAAGKRLCADGEWYDACYGMPMLLFNMTDNWEWTSSPSGAGSYRADGNGSCDAYSSSASSTALAFRCCCTWR
ncbi:MAG: hypothetical protein HY906_02860 [Deltaproteobacteria bacterium]|nr:hypothetical protein [Deltaproteobacteria bacterium]